MNEETALNKEESKGTKTDISKLCKRRKRLLSIAAGIVILLLLIVGIGSYNAPLNRLSRHLEMANKYLIETNYEQAIVEFDKAIEIEPMSVTAYIGKAEAYVGLNDYDKAIETLEAGYLATQGDGDAKESLIDAYKEVLGSSGIEKNYEKKLEIYDRLIELEGYNDTFLNDLEKCLEQYINALLDGGKSDEIRALFKKYKDILTGTDFDTFMIRIEMLLREMGYSSLLTEVQELIISEQYDQVIALAQRREYQDMIASLQEDESYYCGERDYAGKREGIGIAVYKGHLGEYFYYGSWNADERKGQGQAFYPISYDSAVSYGMYIGEWAHGLPNGSGEERYHVVQSELNEETGAVVSLIRGSYKDGLYDGEIYEEAIEADSIESFQGVAHNGVWELLGEVDDEGYVLVMTPLTDSSGNGLIGIEMNVADNKNQGVHWLLP